MTKTNTIDTVKKVEKDAEMMVDKAERGEKEVLAKAKIDHQDELQSFIKELEEENKKRMEEEEKGLQNLKKEKTEKLNEEKQKMLSRIQANKKKAEESIKKEILETINGHS